MKEGPPVTPIPLTAIGCDSHRFLSGDDPAARDRPLLLGGVVLEGCPPLEGNSDADVVLHALTNAISGLTGERILGAAADRLCQAGVTDSRAYVQLALDSLGPIRLTHLSFSVEARRPSLAPVIDRMRQVIARLVGLPLERVAMTATSGEGLTAFGRGEGIACICIASALIETG